jgi:hypothetical protein
MVARVPGVQVLQERRGHLAQAGLHRRQQPDVPEPATHDVVAGRRARQQAECGQLADQPVRRGQRQVISEEIEKIRADAQAGETQPRLDFRRTAARSCATRSGTRGTPTLRVRSCSPLCLITPT